MRLPPRVLPITPGECVKARLWSLVEQLRELERGGAEGVLLREPRLSDADLLTLAKAAREVWPGGWLGVHDRPHVAMAVGADGVHLGYKSLDPKAVKAMLGDEVAVGQSHHSAELSLSAMDADYRFMGPVHATASKEGLLDPLGTAALGEMGLRDRTWALGGIGPREVASVLTTGVAGVAAIGAIFSAEGVSAGVGAMLSAARECEAKSHE